MIPVAILGSSTFDVTLVDTSTLLFGGLEVRVRGNKGPLCNFEDSDGDTILDLVCHFEDNSTNWAPGDGDATITGTLLDTGTVSTITWEYSATASFKLAGSMPPTTLGILPAVNSELPGSSRSGLYARTQGSEERERSDPRVATRPGSRCHRPIDE